MDNAEFVALSRKLVADYARLEIGEVYCVWLTKVLQNNKALLSTTRTDGMYYEITLNGDKNEVYFDTYKKSDNIAIAIDQLY